MLPQSQQEWSPHHIRLYFPTKTINLFFHGISPGFEKKSRTKPQLSHLPMALETEHEVAESWGPWWIMVNRSTQKTDRWWRAKELVEACL